MFRDSAESSGENPSVFWPTEEAESGRGEERGRGRWRSG